MKTFVLAQNDRVEKFQKTLPGRAKIVGWEDFEPEVLTRDESLWVTEELETLRRAFRTLDEGFFKHQAEFRKRVKICLVADAPVEIRRAISGLFKEAFVIPKNSALPLNELLEVLDGKNPDRYVIGGEVDQMTHTVTLVRGDLTSIVVPFSTFRPSGRGHAPDFFKFGVEDCGQTLKFGGYEASVDSVLYEFDPLYRRKRKAELVRKEKGFGASMRRLRLQKGLRQTDFQDIDAREIGRIERGEVKPRRSTIEKLALVLNVSPGDIKTY